MKQLILNSEQETIEFGKKMAPDLKKRRCDYFNR